MKFCNHRMTQENFHKRYPKLIRHEDSDVGYTLHGTDLKAGSYR